MKPKLTRRRRAAVLALLVLSITGQSCWQTHAPIPNAVSTDEYSIYAAWLDHRFTEQPTHLLIANRTFIFDPLGRACNQAALQANTVNRSLLRALHDLGQAEYPLQTGKLMISQFRVRWNYQELEGLSSNPVRPFRLVSFSRVAFNANRTQAFFAVSDACGGLCGRGGALLASKVNGNWMFQANTGCQWVY